jgi:hypothetical protein
MSFELTERNLAILPQDLEAAFPSLVAMFGEELPDGSETVRTIGAHWDDGAKTRIRAASLEKGTITGIPLKDGRLLFRCLWQVDLVAAYEAGAIPQAEELTDEQVQALLPEPEGLE